jgi:hypothetical protein
VLAPFPPKKNCCNSVSSVTGHTFPANFSRKFPKKCFLALWESFICENPPLCEHLQSNRGKMLMIHQECCPKSHCVNIPLRFSTSDFVKAELELNDCLMPTAVDIFKNNIFIFSVLNTVLIFKKINNQSRRGRN